MIIPRRAALYCCNRLHYWKSKLMKMLLKMKRKKNAVLLFIPWILLFLCTSYFLVTYLLLHLHHHNDIDSHHDNDIDNGMMIDRNADTSLQQYPHADTWKFMKIAIVHGTLGHHEEVQYPIL